MEAKKILSKDIGNRVDLIHLWIHQKLQHNRSYTKADTKVIDDCLYIENKLVAYIEGKYLYLMKCKWVTTISSSATNVLEVLSNNKLLTKEIREDKDLFFRWYIDEVKTNNVDRINSISNAKDYANNSRRTRCYVYWGSHHQTKVNIPKDLHKLYYKELMQTKIDIHSSYTRYDGRTRSRSKSLPLVKLTIPIRKLAFFKIESFLTKKERLMFAAKQWRESLIYSTISFAALLPIYTDLNRRKEWNDKNENYRVNQLKIAAQEEKEKVYKQVKNLNAFKDNTDGGRLGFWDIPYIVLRFTKDMITTSKFANITEKDAKRAYTLFQAYRDMDIDVPIRNIAVSHFPVNGVVTKKLIKYSFDGTTVTEEEVSARCLMVGCHTIPDFEIDDFIKRYNLEW